MIRILPAILILAIGFGAASQATAQTAPVSTPSTPPSAPTANANNLAYWSYISTYISYAEGTGSYEAFENAYYAYYATEEAILATLPEGSVAWLDLCLFNAVNALNYAVIDWTNNPNDTTFQAMYYAYYTVEAAYDALDQ